VTGAPVVGCGFFAEFIIGPAADRTGWLSPGMTAEPVARNADQATGSVA
jgi:hypothetical protein